MRTVTASPSALIPFFALVLLPFLASSPATAQLPPAIQADRLLVRAEREIQEGDYAAAAAALEQIVELQEEHGLEVPEAFWFKRGQVAQEAGMHERAIESLLRYLEVAGQTGEHYAAALELLDAAEQATEELKRAEQEALRRKQRAEQEADERMQQAERDIQDGDYAAAATALERVEELQAEHGLEMPTALWFHWAQVEQEAGFYERAIALTKRYVEEAGQEGERYTAALELLDDAEHAKEWAEAAEVLSRFVSDLEMLVIPAGSFQMGCVSGLNCERDEKPVHEVSIRSFALSKHEVTFDDWEACVAAGGCGGYRPNDEDWGRGDRPVIWVSWEDAQLFVAWLSDVTGHDYRLPTESEWEYAARAGTQTKYSWGNDIGRNRANCDNDEGCPDGFWFTAPVGSFGANAFGLHDMHGNVAEWVEDCWNDSYVGAPVDGSAWLSGACERFFGGGRVFRGGSLYDDPGLLRSANRERQRIGARMYDRGFRVARTLTP